MTGFTIGGKKMVLDRGRYKEVKNVGSRSEAKGSGFLGGAVGGMGKIAGEMGKKLGKGISNLVTKKKTENLPKKIVGQATSGSLGGALSTHAKQIRAAEAEIDKQYKK